MQVCDARDHWIDKGMKFIIPYIISDILDEIDPYDICIGRLMSCTDDWYRATFWLEVRRQASIFEELAILFIEVPSTEKIYPIDASYEQYSSEDVL